MATIPIKVLLFIFGAAVAGLGTAYFAGALDPWLGKEQQMEVANQAEVPSSTTETGKSDRPEAGPAPGGQDAGDTVERVGGEKVIVPSFDIVRAEPDGSLVVAGTAAPDAEVEILSGSSVLATTQAGPSGDFAAVLDQALEPGDHNIVLRSTAGDDVVATSEQTAIVSVPSDPSGDVVALVQQPGEPSRLISVPEAPVSGETSAQGTTEKATPEEKLAGTAAPAASDATVPETDIAAAPPRDTSAAKDVKRALPSEAEKLAGSDGAAVADAGGSAETTEVDAAEAGAKASGARTEASADASQAGAPSAGTAADGAPFIEAVEIDGRQIFVAGRAEAGRTVRVYINDTLLGQAVASPTGRFLVETERDLPVGDYIVRADILADDGTVIARAAVPFQRESGEKVAAVARPQPPTGTSPAPGSEKSGQAAQEMSQAPAAGTTTDRGPAYAEDGAEAIAKAGEQTSGGADAPAQRDTRMSSAQTAESMQGGQGDASGDGVVVAQKLEPVDGSVIIRRGDTLWHISRRVYGHGIRYTTIYLANRDQIRDPDLIWPGQVFALPEETDEGEKADLGAIDDQVVEPAEGYKAPQ
ncbi:LysM peptidoglycan-binding domain-containing protein [Nitratireductor luteus]|uniref:LysM peptidoglycan-binding domain-containing protein n=1 Tax=Nitratireductor luteus TaxID=2976980 RepID=UPI00223F64AA|nr:LysM peptidoglycan-binding domain-containing protein [Nitratireductor luteus]